MRIVHRQEFLAMPNGTLFTVLNNRHCDETMEVFLGRCGTNGYFYAKISGAYLIDHNDSSEGADRIEEMAKDSSISYPAAISHNRDGCFETEMEYLIYEKPDVKALIDYLTRALNGQVEY